MRVSSSSEDFMLSRGNYFLFGLVFIKKNNQTEFFFKKTKIGSNRLVSVLFGFFRTNTGSNRIGLVFSCLARFFAGLGLVWFFQF
jgi:hypothetical protein